MIIACPQCGDLDTCYILDLTTYPLVATENGDVEEDLGAGDDAPDWVWSSLPLTRERDNIYCTTCKQRFAFDDVRVLETLPGGETRAVDRASKVVGRVVQLLRDADIPATHEYRNHIVIEREGYQFHWGTNNETWQADVTSDGAEVGHCETEVPSDSTDAFAIFSGIYLETTGFLDRQ